MTGTFLKAFQLYLSHRTLRSFVLLNWYKFFELLPIFLVRQFILIQSVAFDWYFFINVESHYTFLRVFEDEHHVSRYGHILIHFLSYCVSFWCYRQIIIFINCEEQFFVFVPTDNIWEAHYKKNIVSMQQATKFYDLNLIWDNLFNMLLNSTFQLVSLHFWMNQVFFSRNLLFRSWMKLLMNFGQRFPILLRRCKTNLWFFSEIICINFFKI